MKCKAAIPRHFHKVYLVFALVLLLTACFQTGNASPTPVPNPIAAPLPTPTSTPVVTHELELIADPREAADFVVNPKPNPQGAYAAGTAVTIDVLPKEGWEIEQWVGPAYNFIGETAKINMDGNNTVVVRLKPVPAVNLPIPTAIPVPTAAPLPTAAPSTVIVLTPPTLSDSLVAHWPAEGNAEDIVGFNDGNLNRLARFAKGRVGQAFSFPPGWIALPFGKSANKFTFEAWILIDPTSQRWGTIYANNVQGVFLRDSKIIWWDPGLRLVGHSIITTGEWHHIAVTYDGDKFKAFLDGQIDGEGSSPNSSLPVGRNLGIGWHDGWADGFRGLIDEVKIYDRALSPSEIRAIYDAVGLTSTPSPVPTPTPRG